ncbi:MAG: nucleotidyltransferase family protein [Candidatus Omnitrophota bacterium]
MEKNKKSILLLCKIDLTGSEKKEISISFNTEGFWADLDKFAEINRVYPLIYSQLKKIDSDLIIPEKMTKIYLYSLKINTLLKKEFLSVRDKLLENKIPVIPLKGIDLEDRIYKNIGARNMVDIDILVKKEDSEKAKTVLKSLSYSAYPKISPESQIILSKKMSPSVISNIDLHWEIFPPRPYKISLPGIWTSDKLRLEDAVIVTTLHIRRHIRQATFKDFCDVLNILEQKESNIDYSYLKKIAKKNHIKNCLSFSIFAINNIFGTDLPQLFKISSFRKKILLYLFPQDIFFKETKNKVKLSILRIFLFDSIIDIIVYIVRVSLFERRFKI